MFRGHNTHHPTTHRLRKKMLLAMDNFSQPSIKCMFRKVCKPDVLINQHKLNESVLSPSLLPRCISHEHNLRLYYYGWT
jgi:hypothetical protein